MEEEIRKYVVKNLNFSLAVENYEDNTGKTSETIENAWELLQEYRRIRNSLSKEEELKMVKGISNVFDLAIKEIGVENFTFYDDGDINYIWKDGKETENSVDDERISLEEKFKEYNGENLSKEFVWDGPIGKEVW